MSSVPWFTALQARWRYLGARLANWNNYRSSTLHRIARWLYFR